MVPEISFDSNFDMWSAFSWLLQNSEANPDWWALVMEVFTGILGNLLDHVTKFLLIQIQHKPKHISLRWVYAQFNG